MRYKAGDRVVIRKDLEISSEGATVTPQMLQFVGEVLGIDKIVKAEGCDSLLIDAYMVRETEYVWDDAMIDHEATARLNETCEGDIPHISAIKDSGDRSEFPTGAVRDMSEGKGRMDLLCWNAIMEVSKHCEEGAKKYGENNVDKGIPMHSLIDSGMRHLAKFAAGHKDEDHLRAAAWNILWALEFRETKPELNDLYYWNTEV